MARFIGTLLMFFTFGTVAGGLEWWRTRSFRMTVLVFLVASGLSACTVYYYETNLNRLSPGITEAAFLNSFPARRGNVWNTAGAVVRASKVVDGQRIDVVTLPLSKDDSGNATEYWFVFRDKKLEQWGKPQDWQTVAARYQIDFNPAPSVRNP